MVTPAKGALRLARALIVAVVVVALAGGAHVLGGGSLPPAAVCVALCALVLAAVVGATRRRLGWTTSLLLLGAGQLALHGAFSLFQATGCAALVPTGAHAHLDHAAHVASLQAAGCSTAGMAAMTGGLGAWTMTVTHAVATVAAAVAVVGLDKALWWLAVWLRPVIERLAAAPLPAWAQLPVAPDHASFTRQTWRSTVPLRGPPRWEHPVPTAF